MADLPFAPIDASVASTLRSAVDPDGKIVRALEALGPVAGRDVVVLGAAPALALALAELGSRVTVVAPRKTSVPRAKGTSARRRARQGAGTDGDVDEAPPAGSRASPAGVNGTLPAIVAVDALPAATGLPAATADVVVASFDAIAEADVATVAEADRILRSHGRLLVVADYGRDDLDPLRDSARRAALVAASRPRGWFLANGFRIRVIHAWWVFTDCEAAGDLLRAAFGDAAQGVVAAMRRPRLAHKVAVFHRTRGVAQVDGPAPIEVAG